LVCWRKRNAFPLSSAGGVWRLWCRAVAARRDARPISIELFNLGAGIWTAIAVKGNINDAQIHSDNVRDANFSGNVADSSEIPFAAAEHQIDFTLARGSKSALTPAANEGILWRRPASVQMLTMSLATNRIMRSSYGCAACLRNLMNVFAGSAGLVAVLRDQLQAAFAAPKRIEERLPLSPSRSASVGDSPPPSSLQAQRSSRYVSTLVLCFLPHA
jgi:hypothetical protein